ncbi:MAG: response regulator [Treponema sp.]|jgi:twitching motility two-component system response regulator PilH|nr:response regulator [Treponema sp.]
MNEEVKRVLLMENSDIFAGMLTEYFTESGFCIERACNGFEGIKKVFNFKPRLIITDIETPVVKGYHVTRLLKSRKNTKNIPIIMFTTLGEAKDKFWGNQTGADFYIEKTPGNFTELCRKTGEILSLNAEIDFNALEREEKKINDNSIIEMVNNMLDNKLFQTTIIGMFTGLLYKAQPLEKITESILILLSNVCESEIVSIKIRGIKGSLYNYTANLAGFTGETAENFSNITI